jgi:hypothetical protein
VLPGGTAKISQFITALPVALAGIVLCRFFAGTTLSVPALSGAIMRMGVPTAISLMTSFAREQLAAHGDSVRAAIEAGFTRFRPDDLAGDDHRHGADGTRPRRRRRAERATRLCRNCRFVDGHRCHADLRSDGVFPIASPASRRPGTEGDPRMRHEELADVMFHEQDVSEVVRRIADGAAPPPGRERAPPVLIVVVVAVLLGSGIY